MTDAEMLAQLLAGFQRSAWRLEALDRYEADDHYRAYLRGDPAPPPVDEAFVDYLNTLRALPGQGRTMGRVHAIVGPLTPYLRYELDWGYALTADAGDDVRILHRRSWEESPFRAQPPDFWAFDLETERPTVAVMHYAADGRWLGLELVTHDLDEYRVLRDLAVQASMALRSYLTTVRAIALDPTAYLHTPKEAVAS
jgi:hypothetical protein